MSWMADWVLVVCSLICLLVKSSQLDFYEKMILQAIPWEVESFWTIAFLSTICELDSIFWLNDIQQLYIKETETSMKYFLAIPQHDK